MTDDKLSFLTNLFRDANFPELDMEQHAGYIIEALEARHIFFTTRC